MKGGKFPLTDLEGTCRPVEACIPYCMLQLDEQNSSSQFMSRTKEHFLQ